MSITTQFGKIYHCQRLCCTTQCQFLLLLYNTLKDTSRREPIWIHFCPGKKTYSCLFDNTSLFASPSQNPLSSRIQHAFSTLNTLSLYLRTREVETTYSRANLESSRAAAHVALPEHARDTQCVRASGEHRRASRARAHEACAGRQPGRRTTRRCADDTQTGERERARQQGLGSGCCAAGAALAL